MEKRVQFSIFLVNKPGVLSQIFRQLAKAKINGKLGACVMPYDFCQLTPPADSLPAR